MEEGVNVVALRLLGIGFSLYSTYTYSLIAILILVPISISDL